ncbi:MAG TPA: PIN domain-containing protein [Longimicrobiaceae bacterium]|nr:PIN domain-containing protein [Longimicrobiaceae bacterium]
MGILIDASVLIQHERGNLAVGRQFAGRDDDFFLSVVTASELLHGVHRATDPAMKARRSAFVEAVIQRFPILEIDLPTARTHARLTADLAAIGRPIGPNDIWLAATAIAHGLSLVTINVREFSRVAGLNVESWPAA